MTKLLLSVHVLAAILIVGPIAVAASLFPRFAREASEGDKRPALLHRICRGYAVAGVIVPVFGLATGLQLGVLTDVWLLTSIVLTAIAAGILVFLILPRQQRLLTGPKDDRGTVRLAMFTGMFNLVWAVVVVLMIVRPGSTTGA